MTQGILEKHVVLPAIEAEGHFFQISGKMFRGDFVPRSRDTALQKREGIFDGVCVHFTRNVHPAAVIDGLVPISTKPSIHHRSWIADPIVSDKHVRIWADVFADVLSKGRSFSVFHMEKQQLPAALTDTKDDVLFGSMRAASAAFH